MGIAIVGFHLVSSIRTPSARQSTLFEHMELPYATNATPCNLAATIGHWDLGILWTLGLGHWSFATPAPSAQHPRAERTHQKRNEPKPKPTWRCQERYFAPRPAHLILTKRTHRPHAPAQAAQRPLQVANLNPIPPGEPSGRRSRQPLRLGHGSLHLPQQGVDDPAPPRVRPRPAYVPQQVGVVSPRHPDGGVRGKKPACKSNWSSSTRDTLARPNCTRRYVGLARR